MVFGIFLQVFGVKFFFMITYSLCNQQLHFVKMNNFSNLKFNNEHTLDSSAGNLEDCAVQCEISNTCLSFQHNPNTNECVLFKTIHYSTLKSFGVPGWNYFIRTGGRCQDGFNEARRVNVCFTFVGYSSVFDGRKECSRRNSDIIAIRSKEEGVLLKTLMYSLFEQGKKTTANKPYIQGRWNGTRWVFDDGKVLEYTMEWISGTDLSKLQYNDRLSYYPRRNNIAFSDGKSSRPIVCAYDVI